MLNIEPKERILTKVLVICLVIIPIITFTSCAPSLVTSIRNGDTERVKNLLAKGGEDVNRNITWTISFADEQLVATTCPLIIAVKEGKKEIVDLLLKAGANPDGTNLASVTPLYAATFEAGVWWFSEKEGLRIYDKGIIHLLLNHGADVNNRINGTKLLITGGKGINHPFFKAAHELGLYLNVDGYFTKGSTPLHMAAIHGLEDIVLLYLEKGAKVNAKNEVGWAPLHLAAKMKNLKVAKLLIEHGANVNIKDNAGETPLMMAAHEGYTEVAELLIKHGADVNAKDNNGKTALIYAKDKGHEDMVRLLRRYGAH